jgi:molybdenum cofactor cytidylyltransferase
LSRLGLPLVRYVALEACRSQSDRTAIVIGASGRRVRAAIAGLGLEELANPTWEEGIASSIRTAADWAEQRELDRLLIVLADQPSVTARHLDRLLLEPDEDDEPIASFYAGALGVPALFPRTWFTKLKHLHGDTGAATLLRAHERAHAVELPGGEIDLDTPDQARAWQERLIH